MSMTLPQSEERSEYQERLAAAYRNFRAGNVTRLEYLDEVSRITREQRSISAWVNGRRVALDPVAVDNELREHQWNVWTGPVEVTDDTGRTRTVVRTTGRQPGLSTRQLAGAMDAADAEKTKAAHREARDE